MSADLPEELARLLAAPGLGKWPRLLVAGDRVTEEQANEIIFRTCSWYGLFTNDRAWLRTVADVVGLPIHPRHGWVETEPALALRERMRGVELEYLGNTGRIASSWIGGPHGWCDWDGRIGCSTYNIGKWPERDEVTAEWRAIAAAFPWLRLRAQLVPDEGAAGRAAAEWRVAGGVAEVCEPSGLLAPPVDLPDALILARLLTGGGERGVSLERLRAAAAQVLGG